MKDKSWFGSERDHPVDWYIFANLGSNRGNYYWTVWMFGKDYSGWTSNLEDTVRIIKGILEEQKDKTITAVKMLEEVK